MKNSTSHSKGDSRVFSPPQLTFRANTGAAQLAVASVCASNPERCIARTAAAGDRASDDPEATRAWLATAFTLPSCDRSCRGATTLASMQSGRRTGDGGAAAWMQTGAMIRSDIASAVRERGARRRGGPVMPKQAVKLIRVSAIVAGALLLAGCGRWFDLRALVGARPECDDPAGACRSRRRSRKAA